MTNSQMKPGRFERWARYRKLYARIQECLAAGGCVQVCTYTRATEYRAKHAGLFSVDRNGVYVQAGKRRDDIQFCGIRFYREA